MKTVLTKFLAISSVALLMLASCKKDQTLVTSNGGKPGALTANTSAPVVLDKAMVNDTTTVIRFNFTKANYGFSAAVTNTLQIDAPGDNWKSPTTFTLASGAYSQGFSTPAFNSLLLKLNLPAGVASQVNVRVAHSISTTVAPVYTNVLSLTVTPFNLQSWVYVPGSCEGWANSTDHTTAPLEDSLYSATSNGIYVGIINFPAGDRDFLVVPVKGSWAYKYATNDAETTNGTAVTYSTTYVASGGNNFFAPTTAGYYLVTLNTNNNTLTMAQADFYSIVGSAPPGTAWNTDSPMKYLNDGTNTWVATNIPMIVGEYKFRQDDAWSNSWGPSATAGTVVSANATGDGNIQLTTAGNYNFTFVMPAAPLGSTPLVTTTYTAVKQ